MFLVIWEKDVTKDVRGDAGAINVESNAFVKTEQRAIRLMGNVRAVLAGKGMIVPLLAPMAPMDYFAIKHANVTMALHAVRLMEYVNVNRAGWDQDVQMHVQKDITESIAWEFVTVLLVLYAIQRLVVLKNSAIPWMGNAKTRVLHISCKTRQPR